MTLEELRALSTNSLAKLNDISIEKSIIETSSRIEEYNKDKSIRNLAILQVVLAIMSFATGLPIVGVICLLLSGSLLYGEYHLRKINKDYLVWLIDKKKEVNEIRENLKKTMSKLDKQLDELNFDTYISMLNDAWKCPQCGSGIRLPDDKPSEGLLCYCATKLANMPDHGTSENVCYNARCDCGWSGIMDTKL